MRGRILPRWQAYSGLGACVVSYGYGSAPRPYVRPPSSASPPARDEPSCGLWVSNAKLAQDVARDLFAEGIYVVGFFFPVVAKGQARIRTQLSAAHTTEQLDRAIEAFRRVGKKHDILGKSKNEIVERYGL